MEKQAQSIRIDDIAPIPDAETDDLGTFIYQVKSQSKANMLTLEHITVNVYHSHICTTANILLLFSTIFRSPT